MGCFNQHDFENIRIKNWLLRVTLKIKHGVQRGLNPPLKNIPPFSDPHIYKKVLSSYIFTNF